MHIPSISRKNEEMLLAVSSATAADAATGAEFSFTVPAGERWLLLAVTVACVQGATDQPWPRLVIDDGSVTRFVAHSGTAAQAVNTTCQHSWIAGGPNIGPSGLTTAVAAQGSLPDGLVLEAGWRITSSTVGIAATTNYGVPIATIVKLPATG